MPFLPSATNLPSVTSQIGPTLRSATTLPRSCLIHRDYPTHPKSSTLMGMSYFRRRNSGVLVHPVIARATSQALGGTKTNTPDQAVLDKIAYDHIKRIIAQARVRGGI